ncbi:hypothetical protein TAMA11512_01170 [Selenomonas sp. TAMA-11512]|uniref:hypothetical protein n=1 Tax=Selenomonas sp. TAMA-11512 TaxID=3095337 RepID=UPI00308C0BCD|nr:hypothetical protein TAMA11512_01170 [Selenomonas sp. TAMA-11512]
MPEEIRAIQCQSCGGAMYSDQKAAAYICAFCGTSVPWTNEQVFWASPITFRHKPVQIIDGAMKLGHVEVMTEVDPHDERVLSQKYRQNSVADKLTLWDETTTAAFAGVCRLTFRCPFCGGEFSGESTQHFFTCDYCSNTFEDEELVRPGGYRREFIMGVGAENVPDRAIPFAVTPVQAQSAVRALVQKFPQVFAGQDIERRIRAEMTAIYIPFSLADLSVKMSVRSERGDFEAYEEIVNWACPDTTLYDIHLLDRLDPWDFGAVTPFDPAFAEGVFRIAAVANNASRADVIDNLLAERLVSDIKDTFDLKKTKIVLWGQDFRKHKSAHFLLPVYYLDRRTEDGAGARQIRIAVNGQTGKAAALLYHYGKEERYVTLAPSLPRAMSTEHTVRTPPVAVKRIGSPFLHRTLPLEKVLKKSFGARLRSLFGG